MNNPGQYLPHIILALIIAILPHLARLPVWIIVWCTLMWGYALFSMRLQWPQPSRAVRILLSVLGLIGLLATYGTRLGPNAYLGLLSLMAALKPFEISTHRDRLITLFLAYFIVITSLFQSESLSITLYMFLSVFVTTGTLIRINDPGGNFKSGLRLSGIIMAQAIPLMLVLFLLFPRIQGSIYGLSQSPAGRTGFSNRLSPGNVARLVEDNEIAFRAEFTRDIPKPERLYWRGMVFYEFDGRNWRRLNRMQAVNQLPSGHKSVDYSIALEPHGQRWLFVLDRPGSQPKWTRMYADYTLRNRRPVNRTKYYDMTSFIQPRKGPPWGVEAAKQLPEAGNPQSRKLAADFAESSPSVDEVVRRALAYLRHNGFVYSLTPPLLGRHPIDDFLFRSQKGYCEHYASAFAFLMRAAHVPARIVGGYLGGQVNPFGNYLIVRQSDAHVWVEVWSDETGWMRVDPTAAVAPARITEGVSGALPKEEFSGGLAFGWLQQLHLGWDAISSGWEAWFSGYSYLEQKAMLERLGIRIQSWKGLLTVLLFVLAMIFLVGTLYVVIQLTSGAMEKDRVRICYEKFCRKLEKVGLMRPPDKGPVDFAEHIARERPDLKPAVDEIVQLYVWLRFKESRDIAMQRRFCELVKAFKPRPDK